MRETRDAGFLGAFEERLRRLQEEIEEQFGPDADGDAKMLVRLAAMGDTAMGLLASVGRRVERGREVFSRRLLVARRDEFGFDPFFQDLLLATFRLLYHFWWRVEARGIENVPARGPAILISNHSGAVLPCDAGMVLVSLLDRHPQRRRCRALLDGDAPYLPGADLVARRSGLFCYSLGGARKALDKGQCVVVFPEGGRGVGKYPAQRREVFHFRHYGIFNLALKTGIPLVPVAVGGGEAAYPLLAKVPIRAKRLAYLPVTPIFPWLGLAGLLPFPSKWTIAFGKPLAGGRPWERGDPAAGRRLGARVRTQLKDMLSQL